MKEHKGGSEEKLSLEVEHVEEVSDRKDSNYLAFSDTDTVECYLVPSPIYPTLPHEQERWTPITTITPTTHNHNTIPEVT